MNNYEGSKIWRNLILLETKQRHAKTLATRDTILQMNSCTPRSVLDPFDPSKRQESNTDKRFLSVKANGEPIGQFSFLIW